MFARVNPLGWALFEELTSAQMNQLDINMTRAIDTLGGGTYNLGAPIVINNQLITFVNNTYTRRRVITGVDSEHTYSAADADVIIVPNLTATHYYHMGIGNEGDQLEFFMLQDTDPYYIDFNDSPTTPIFAQLNWDLSLRNYAVGDVFAVRFVFHSTAWHVMSASVVQAP